MGRIQLIGELGVAQSIQSMRYLRGFLYWLMTDSWLAWVVGTAFSRRAFDRHGRLSVPLDASPYLVSGLIFGAYEYSERYLIRKWLPKNCNVVELGASIGVISREILHRIDAHERLIAVEAVPSLVELARANIGRRHASSRWRILPAAIAYEAREVAFHTGEEHVAGRIAPAGHIEGKTCLKVQAKTLSDILSEFALTDYSLIMDIEGAEHEVIAHDRKALSGCQCLITELHGSQEDKNVFCRVVAELGMTMVERKHSVVVFLRQ